MRKTIVVMLSLLLLVSPYTLADQQRGLRNYLDIMKGRKTIEQLSPQEAREVLEIHKALQRGRSGGQYSGSRPTYQIEVSHNDELFIINGEKYEAKTYCFNMEEGDLVIFIEGSAFGACASATVVNLRTNNKCELWCE